MRRWIIVAALLLCLPGMSEAQSCDGCGIGYRPSSVSSNDPTISGNTTLDLIVEPSAPTVAVNATAGNLNGNYYYRVTFVTADAETNSCAGCNSLVVAPANQQVNVSAIPVSSDPRVVARKIYRTAAGGSYFTDMRLVATINDNTTTTLTDNVSDAARGALMPWANTTGAKFYRNADLMIGADETYTAFGYKAMPNFTAFDNVAIGPYALLSVTTGEGNVAIGPDAMRLNTTGRVNTAIGESALYVNTIGSSDVAIGYSAMHNNTEGDSNVAIGGTALYHNTIGDDNIAIGDSALLENTEGLRNIGLGDESGKTNTTGDDNVSIGRAALGLNATGSANVGIGTLSLLSVLGSNTAAFGYAAGRYETGSDRVYIDTRDRGSLANGQTLSLFYGVTGAAVKNQTATINGFFALAGIAFADLGTPANGTFAYCSDCAKATPCAGSGSGALAKRLNGAWDCD